MNESEDAYGDDDRIHCKGAFGRTWILGEASLLWFLSFGGVWGKEGIGVCWGRGTFDVEFPSVHERTIPWNFP